MEVQNEEGIVRAICFFALGAFCYDVSSFVYAGTEGGSINGSEEASDLKLLDEKNIKGSSRFGNKRFPSDYFYAPRKVVHSDEGSTNTWYKGPFYNSPIENKGKHEFDFVLSKPDKYKHSYMKHVSSGSVKAGQTYTIPDLKFGYRLEAELRGRVIGKESSCCGLSSYRVYDYPKAKVSLYQQEQNNQ